MVVSLDSVHHDEPASPPQATAPPERRKFVPPSTGESQRSASPSAINGSVVYVPPPTAELVRPAVVAPELSLPTSVAPPPLTAKARAGGRIIWTGGLRKGGLLFIDGPKASSGALAGSLPGVPVVLRLQTGELTSGGLLIYTSDPRAGGRSESPGSQNGWNHAIYEHDPKRIADVEVMEAPAPANGWKKLVIRSLKRPVSVIFIDWEPAPVLSQRSDSGSGVQVR